MRPAVFLALVAFGITVRADNGASCSITTPNLTVLYGTCLPVGSPQIESKHVCKGFYMTNVCSDPSVRFPRDALDRDCLLHQHTLQNRGGR